MNIVSMPLPTDEPGVHKVKRVLNTTLHHMRRTVVTIKTHSDTVGKATLEAELGADAAELEAAYNALRTAILALDDTLTIPDL